MKISKYTFLLPKEDDCTILYNCRNEALAVIESELADLLSTSSTEHIRNIHPTFYDFLVKRGFIVTEGTVEEEGVISDWKRADQNRKSFSIFLNPTLDCNLRCWYCYEKHVKGSHLSESTVLSIVRLIKKKIEEDHIELLSFSFFGGEPLTTFGSSVLPLLQQAKAICIENNILLYVSFVSNATLITDEILDQLASLPTCEPVQFQITLDGNETLHNQTKQFPNGNGTYSLIITNLKKVLSHKMNVTLRFNMTKENVKSYYDVLEDLHDLPKENKQRLIIDLQRVWQDASSTDDKSDFLREQGKMRAAFMEEGFRVNELKHIDTSRCYADRENHIALNYDGSLFKCTARDFTTDNREGILLPDGTLAWNEKYSKRMAIKYGNAYCRTCRIFPLCHGGCSQYKLDCENSGSNEDECIRGYDATYMTKIVEDRVSFLLERITPN